MWCFVDKRARPSELSFRRHSDLKSARAPVFVDVAKHCISRGEAPQPAQHPQQPSAQGSPFGRIYVEEGRRPGQLSFHIGNQGDAFVSLRDSSMDGDFGEFIEETCLERKRYPLQHVLFELGGPSYNLIGDINWGRAVHGVQEWSLKLEFDELCESAHVSVFRTDGLLSEQVVSSFVVHHWRALRDGPHSQIFVPPGHQPGEFSLHMEDLKRTYVSFEAAPGKDNLLDSFLKHSCLERRRYPLSDVTFDQELQAVEGRVHWGREVDGREDWQIRLVLGSGSEKAELMMFKGGSLEDRLDMQLWQNQSFGPALWV